jgi:hypothetical protein
MTFNVTNQVRTALFLSVSGIYLYNIMIHMSFLCFVLGDGRSQSVVRKTLSHDWQSCV